MNLEKQISIWADVGYFLTHISSPILEEAVVKTYHSNPWFRKEDVLLACKQWADTLTNEKLNAWLLPYAEQLQAKREHKTVGVVMAGNIPLVGFHDFMCVLISGHSIEVKLSHEDQYLLPALTNFICEKIPDLSKKIRFTSERLSKFDAIIATGSNNTSRYFDYYFGKYPHIIRKNRNSVAILTGAESEQELKELAKDIFMYFGLGCRSISKIFVPENYDFTLLKNAFLKYVSLLDHSRYGSSYDYHKAIYMMSSVEYKDLGMLLLTNSEDWAAPVGVLNFSYYSDIQTLNNFLIQNKDIVQCVVSSSENVFNALPLGTAQFPALNDYADGIDTMKFLLQI